MPRPSGNAGMLKSDFNFKLHPELATFEQVFFFFFIVVWPQKFLLGLSFESALLKKEKLLLLIIISTCSLELEEEVLNY